MKGNTLVLLLTAIISLTYVGTIVVRHERVAASEGTVFLELAPVDPLSLLQGQYMNVEFLAERQLYEDSTQKIAKLGYNLAVIQLNERNIGTVREFIPPRPKLSQKQELNSTYGAGEFLLFGVRLTPAGGNRKPQNGEARKYKISIDQQQFMFRENSEDLYRDAKYGYFRVAPDGSYQLIDLADEHLKLLSPKK